MADLIVEEGKVVLMNYILTDDAGKELDRSDAGQPLPYLHGFGNIVPGLESALTGKTVGDKLDVKVAPADGYGERDPKGKKQVPRTAFPDDVELAEGMQFATQGPDGEMIPLWVTKVSALSVEIDLNHPLAGETLNFAVEITGIRDAAPEEIEHGHVHGPGGHHHH